MIYIVALIWPLRKFFHFLFKNNVILNSALDLPSLPANPFLLQMLQLYWDSSERVFQNLKFAVIKRVLHTQDHMRIIFIPIRFITSFYISQNALPGFQSSPLTPCLLLCDLSFTSSASFTCPSSCSSAGTVTSLAICLMEIPIFPARWAAFI